MYDVNLVISLARLYLLQVLPLGRGLIRRAGTRYTYTIWLERSSLFPSLIHIRTHTFIIFHSISDTLALVRRTRSRSLA